ncbi:DUF86 domain-containing protein [Patescibacteria group bacterium]|nr:DUF86 domain-containing protein [Patescibacteria group bacterium]MBU1663279.1 DUF86 domain-containing protein [Patescibacteria group bacterium]MBU1933873.1 DUF86 domain-containing protein [Patescibacteria group bacterium]MBU2007958.1 DUF86 domain-containing protein [Patescibacteria group bacterium]MBU2233572.1 DUF86 domain-containing protein [Patescibacteria group bacterium]
MTTAKYTLKTHQNILKENIKKLERYKKRFSKKAFLDDELVIDAICKALGETIEIMLTTGNMIIAQKGFKKPEKNDDIFDILANEKIYSKNLANKLWGLGGFRNILVHNYITIDLNLVYNHLEKGIPIFKEYAKHIAKFLV